MRTVIYQPQRGDSPQHRAQPYENPNPMANKTELADELEALKLEYQKLSLDYEALKAAYEELASAPMLPVTKTPAKAATAEPNPVMEVDGGLYQLTTKEISIRKLGKRTALDIAADDQPYSELGGLTIAQWLVANNSSAIAAVPKP
jgi:hypothetical protein